MSSFLTGFCRSALDMDRKGHGGEVSNELHSNCRGSFLNVFENGTYLVECECNCHIDLKPYRNFSAEIRQAKYDKALADGATATEAKSVGHRTTKSHCKHNHEMTEANTGPNNVCRQCKRISSQQHKERHAHD